MKPCSRSRALLRAPLATLAYAVAVLMALTCVLAEPIPPSPIDGPHHKLYATPAEADGPYFPESQLVLDMAILSTAVYHLRNKVQSCVDVQAKNKTMFDFVRQAIGDEGRSNSTEAQDIYDLLLPGGAKCLLYSHDYSLGTQVLIVRSTIHKYVAVVYAGTDDWKTTLTDGDILTSNFGPDPADYNGTQSTSDGISSLFRDVPDGVRVHRGFNSAVFDNDGFHTVLNCVSEARLGGNCDGSTTGTDPSPAPYPLFTAGHSLGGADSVLLGAALHLAYPDETIRSINFGCPKIGNAHWSYWIDSLQEDNGGHALADGSRERSGSFTIFRFVNKIDVVPRLPELYFTHAGHTLQMSLGGVIKAYYDHLGNDELGYAGVGMGWDAAAFALLPGAIANHMGRHYVKYLKTYQPALPNATSGNAASNEIKALYYVHDFERVENDTQVVTSYS